MNTRQRDPTQWAAIQNSLGIALATLAEQDSERARLEEAVGIYRQVLEEATRGGGGILKALTTADANIALLNVAVGAPLIKSGEVFPVVATSKTRLKNYPDVPTLEELGIKDVGNTLWHAVWAPAATPPATMKILFDGIQKAMKGPKDAVAVREGRDVGAR